MIAGILSLLAGALTLANLYPTEHVTIMEAAKANRCSHPVLVCVLHAIRTAENGRPGLEFGVMHPRAKDQPNSLRVQAGWAAATVSKNLTRWLDSGEDVDFITYLGRRYAPVGVKNDPTNLNQHWVGNVKRITARNLQVHSQWTLNIMKSPRTWTKEQQRWTKN
jgi:hypothetical protein